MSPTTVPAASARPRHLKRLAAGALPLVLLASVGLAGRAEAAGTPVVCGATLTVSTRLTKDLYCPAGNGLTLGPSVHLNLGGHKLVGPGSSGTGIASTSDNVSVRNGQVKNWGAGIVIGGDGVDEGPGPGPSVTNVVLRNAPSYVQFSARLSLTRVMAIDSTIWAQLQTKLKIVKSEFIRSSIYVSWSSASIDRSHLVASTVDVTESDVTINRSLLDGRRTAELGYLGEGVIFMTNCIVKNYKSPIVGRYSGVHLIDNTFTDMPGGVLGYLASGTGSEGASLIRGNTFTRSGVVLDPRTPMTIDNNVFRNNTEGAVFRGSVPPGAEMWEPGRVTNNIFVGNTSNGIRSDIPGLIVGGNTAKRNGGYGIYAPGAVDLGDNVAYRNKLGDCVGVACSARR